MDKGPGDIFDRRFREVDALFAATLERPPDERMAFLGEACGEDSALFSAVQELLEALNPSHGILDRDAPEQLWDRALEAWKPDAALGPGDVLGAFRLVREIDRGGMGTVFEAERCDDQFHQRVALKVLRRGLDTADVVQRFVAERQILASLHHPHIARVLDGGATPDGRPFLVMELVQGEPVLEFCDQREMSLTARLRLFLDIADAVAHAHRNLVVHRDLKPSNVLVTDDGMVKLLDFGIAKILDASTVPERTPLTRDRVLLTLAYASPEQARGDAVTTSTDVYGLGLLLHELLTGCAVQPPGDVEALGWILSDDEAPPPSAVAARSTREGVPGPQVRARARGLEPTALRRRLRGDLDAIVLTAIRKDAGRRYGSVEALAADIRLYLADRPVSARRDSVAYRARAFVRRNRPLSAVAALLVLVAASYMVVLRRQTDLLREQTARAESEAHKAERVKNFLLGTFEMADPVRSGGEVTVRQILDMGARRARTDLDGQPAVQTEMLGVIGRAYHSLSLDDEGQPYLEEAVRVWERTGVDSAAVAPSLALLGARMARTFHEDSARALFRRAVSVAYAVRGPASPLAARVLTEWAFNASDPAERRALSDTAVAILRRHPERPEDLAQALMSWTSGPHGRQRIREALALREQAFGEGSAQVAWALNDLGLALQRTDPDSAEALIRKALDIHRRVAGERQTTTLVIMNNLAGLLRDQARYREAEPLYRKLLAARRQVTPNDSVDIAYGEYGLGWCLGETGHTEEAEPLLRDVIAMFPEGDLRRNRARAVLGHALTLAGRYDEAGALFTRALEGARAPGTSDAEKAFVLTRLEDLYRRTGREAEADSVGRRLGALGARPGA